MGVAYVENGETYVLEAVPYGVVKSKLDKFFRNSQLIDGKPVVVVGRLKPRLQKNIPAIFFYMYCLRSLFPLIMLFITL